MRFKVTSWCERNTTSAGAASYVHLVDGVEPKVRTVNRWEGQEEAQGKAQPEHRPRAGQEDQVFIAPVAGWAGLQGVMYAVASLLGYPVSFLRCCVAVGNVAVTY